MRTFYRISDDLLIIEAIRRLRTRSVISGGRTAPEGTQFEKLLQALTDSGLFTAKELGEGISTLLQSSSILLTARASFREAGQRHSTRSSKKGEVGRLHPDATLAAVQYFTQSGTPIISRRDRESGRLIYPGETVSYWSLRFDRIYIVSDGLPKSMSHTLNAVEPY